MKRWIFLYLAASVISSHAALKLVARETFVGPGTLTSSSPGANFSSVTGTFTLVRVGPRTSAIAAPGWSADIRTSGPSNFRGTVNLSGSAVTCGMWGAWVRIKALPPAGGFMSVLQLLNRSSSNVVMDFTINSSGVISASPFDSGATPPTFTSPAITPNTWVWLAVAWQVQSGSNFPYGIRCMSKTLTGSLATWGSADHLNALDTTFTAVNIGLQTGGIGPMVRIGCPSLYSMSSFSDIAYPSDILPPVEKSNNWYVNPVSGNDANDGATPATAWKTADKVSTESRYSGLLDSNVAGPGNGDVVTIDTSGGSLPIGTNSLAFATKGLKVMPVSGQTYIKCQAEVILANANFSLASGLSKTYQTIDTQSNIVAWENDKWMWHIKSAAFGQAALVTNPQTGVTTNYASTGVALDAIAGSFYTDGSHLYIHPFGDTNPKTDGKTYTRSINRNQNSAVVFLAGNYRAIGFYVRKTTLVDSGDNDFGAYCFQDEVLSGSDLSNSVEGGFFAYGDKHCFGSTGGATASSLLVLNTECEQGHPYCGFGGQTPFVSYNGATTADNVHTYRGCICLKRSGLIASTAGDALGTGGDIILSHNDGPGITFASITLDNCNFASGSANISVASSFVVTNQTKIGQIVTGCASNTIQQSTFTAQLVSMQSGASTLSVQNCLVAPTFVLSQAPPYYGFLLHGGVSIQGCTFDLSGITGSSTSYFKQGLIQRQGPLNLVYRNNVYLVPAGQDMPPFYGLTSSDALTVDHNAYNLGAGTTLARNFQGSSTLTFAQWQALGNDCLNSSLNANLKLQADVPQTGSPLFNAGIDFGSAPDVTGTVYAHRNTIGAYQGTASYLAAQGIPSFAAVRQFAAGAPVSLPAVSDAGLALVYTVLSGPARVSGSTLTFIGTGTVTLQVTQAGDGSHAPLSAVETITVVASENDIPTMPGWALIALAVALVLAMSRKTVRPH